MSTVDELLHQVLALSEGERAIVAQELLLSLDPDETDPDADAAWAAEIATRLEAVESGDFEAQEWREALEELRAELEQG